MGSVISAGCHSLRNWQRPAEGYWNYVDCDRFDAANCWKINSIRSECNLVFAIIHRGILHSRVNRNSSRRKHENSFSRGITWYFLDSSSAMSLIASDSLPDTSYSMYIWIECLLSWPICTRLGIPLRTEIAMMNTGMVRFLLFASDRLRWVNIRTDYCLAHLLRAIILRCIAHPDQYAVVRPAESPIPTEEADEQAHLSLTYVR